MTMPNVPTSNELMEQLRSTHRTPFVSVEVRRAEPAPVQDAMTSEETYERLRQEFDGRMRGVVSLTRLAVG